MQIHFTFPVQSSCKSSICKGLLGTRFASRRTGIAKLYILLPRRDVRINFAHEYSTKMKSLLITPVLLPLEYVPFFLLALRVKESEERTGELAFPVQLQEGVP